MPLGPYYFYPYGPMKFYNWAAGGYADISQEIIWNETVYLR